jgi:hypothetical protein
LQRGKDLVGNVIAGGSPEQVRPHALQADESPQAAVVTSNPAFRVVECFVILKGQHKFLYRTTDCEGNMLDFVLNDAPAREAAVLHALDRLAARRLTAPTPSLRTAASGSPFSLLQSSGQLNTAG